VYFIVPKWEVDTGTDEIEPCAGWEICIDEYDMGEGGPQKDRLFEYIRLLDLKTPQMKFANWVIGAERERLGMVQDGVHVAADAECLQVWKGYGESMDHPRHVLVDVEVLRQVEKGD